MKLIYSKITKNITEIIKAEVFDNSVYINGIQTPRSPARHGMMSTECSTTTEAIRACKALITLGVANSPLVTLCVLAEGTWINEGGDLIFTGSGLRVRSLGRVWVELFCDGEWLKAKPYRNSKLCVFAALK